MKTLVIVESPAKAKKIQGFLGSDHTVLASVGHVRELVSPKAMTKAQKERFGSYALDTKDGSFEPLFRVDPAKTKTVSAMKTALKKSDRLVLATDDDAEGAAISWHLLEILKPTVPTYRATWHEITERAVNEGMKAMELIDQKKREPQGFFQAAESALSRSAWDRLYGFSTSPYVWRTVKQGTSSGRVQTPGARLVVEREERRLAFKSVAFYNITGDFEGVQATLTRYQGQKIANAKDLDDDGNLRPGTLLITDENLQEILQALPKKDYRTDGVKSRAYKRNPPQPFTTSSALQAIGGKLRMGTKQITATLQHLYASEGAITYIRTVSITMAPEAVTAARKSLTRDYGNAYLPPKGIFYKDKKESNSGHECIRVVVGSDGGLLKKRFSDPKTQGVFDIIYRRTLASQSIPCEGTTYTLAVKSTDGEAVFEASETEIHEPGWTKIYQEES